MSHYPESGEHVKFTMIGYDGEHDGVTIGQDCDVFVVKAVSGTLNGLYQAVPPEDIRAITRRETAISVMMQAVGIKNPGLKSSKIAQETCAALYDAGGRLMPDDFFTHRNSWLACMNDLATDIRPLDDDDNNYYQHQYDAMVKVYQQLDDSQ